MRSEVRELRTAECSWADHEQPVAGVSCRAGEVRGGVGVDDEGEAEDVRMEGAGSRVVAAAWQIATRLPAAMTFYVISRVLSRAGITRRRASLDFGLDTGSFKGCGAQLLGCHAEAARRRTWSERGSGRSPPPRCRDDRREPTIFHSQHGTRTTRRRSPARCCSFLLLQLPAPAFPAPVHTFSVSQPAAAIRYLGPPT